MYGEGLNIPAAPTRLRSTAKLSAVLDASKRRQPALPLALGILRFATRPDAPSTAKMEFQYESAPHDQFGAEVTTNAARTAAAMWAKQTIARRRPSAAHVEELPRKAP